MEPQLSKDSIMKRHLLTLLVLLLGWNLLNANPVGLEKARIIGLQFASAKLNSDLKDSDLDCVYMGTSNRGESCFYVFNVGTKGFVIISADDRFRPVVGYSDEGIFETQNMSPELAYYLGEIIKARTSRNAVLLDNTAEEWESVATTGKLISRNGGGGVDYLCQTKWNQDSPYNLYAPEASGGPGGRCYAGCVATAMSQVMKYWDHPAQGSGSHSYYSSYGMLSANFGATTYHWDLMPNYLGSSSQEEVEAVALLMYHCGVSVDMGYSPSGSGAYSWDVPNAIRQYFSYSTHASLQNRDSYSLVNWQNKLKESFDLGWPVYYSGYSDTGGHAFVCDGYDDDDLFHFNWGWGGNSDGWFVIDEIDYAGGASAIFNFVPSDVYDYMPLEPDDFEVTSVGDLDFSAVLQWTNPVQNIHFNDLETIDQIVVTRNDKVIYTEDNVTPGATMSFTDHYMPTRVNYAVYAVVHNAKGVKSVKNNVVLGPTRPWVVELSSSDAQGWGDGYLSFVDGSDIEIAHLGLTSSSATYNIQMPGCKVDVRWKNPSSTTTAIMAFKIWSPDGELVVSFEGTWNDLRNGLFYIINNNGVQNDDGMEGPTNLRADVVGDDVNLTWIAVPQAVHYLVYRDNLIFALTDTPSFVDANGYDAMHTYFVTAINEDGETPFSNVVNVQPVSSNPAPTNFRYEMTAPSKVKLSWDAPEAENLAGYIIYRRVKGESFKCHKLTSNTEYIDNLSSKPNDCYQYAVVAQYNSDQGESAYASTEANAEMYFLEVNKTIIPRQLEYEIEGEAITLHWQDASMAESYDIYRNGDLLAENITENTFTDVSAIKPQDYCYTVVGKNDFVHSNPANLICIDWTWSVDEEDTSVSVYPNPTAGEVCVEANALCQVQVLNVMGQEVMRQVADGDRMTLDLGGLSAGTYFVRIATDHDSETVKVLKTRD